MKKLSITGLFASPIALFLCALLVGMSCSEEKVVVESPKDDTEELVNFLEMTGFHRDEIVLEEDLFIIDEDILISKAEVQAYVDLEKKNPTAGKTDHYRGYYLVSDSYVTNIKFYIESSVPSAWVTAIRGAIDQWNAVNGTKLYLSEVSSRNSANTVINTSYSSSNWVAQAYLPSSSRRPGHTMTINTRYNSLDSGRKLFTIVHEMGHIFGLYHTDQSQGYFIQGTPQVDPNSVMNSYVLPWNGFTSGDMQAVQIIYPQ